MKKYLLMFMTGLIFLNAFTVHNVSAQTLKVISAEVPFDFHVGDKTYAAGTYRLESDSQSSGNVLRLRGTDEKNKRLLVTSSTFANRRQTPKLVFYRVGDEYYLSNIFMEDGNWGFALRMSRQVKEGKKLPSTKIVEVAATK